jgi:hypothetical protein
MIGDIIELAHKKKTFDRIQDAKWAYTTRRIDRTQPFGLIEPPTAPTSGDIALARVTKIGQHKRIELTNGRKARLYPGDQVVVAYGNRYAPDQFEAVIPDTLGKCDLVAAGGVASKLTLKHGSMKAPTTITPLGLLADENGKVVNLADHALSPKVPGNLRPPVIAVLGSSMNAGKTTTAAHLIRGLSGSGLSVNAGKVTGTGAGRDTWSLKDAGARFVLDFVDAGHPSTYLITPAAVKRTLATLLAHLHMPGTDIIVIEIADGLHQSETAGLASSDLFSQLVDGVLYAAGDALGAVYGARLLHQWGVDVLAISGMVTRSPLAMREIQDGIDLPILTTKALRKPSVIDVIDTRLHLKDTALRRSGDLR